MSTRRVEVPRGQSVALVDPEPNQVSAVPDSRGHRPGERCREPGCVNCHWDAQRLKFWLRARLLAAGADEVQVDVGVGDLIPDLLWRKGDRVCVIQVHSAAPELGRARQMTAALQADGCGEVLWITPPGFWTAQLPALGIDDFAPAACDYRVLGGMLAAGPGGVVSPSQSACELRELITGWVAEELAYGFRDEHTGGWATVTDWERHTRTQAAVIARQRQELMNQRTALALARKATRDKTKQMLRLTHRLERAEAAAQDQADDLAQARRRIADHSRVDATLRITVAGQKAAIMHWQLISWFALLIIVTFIAAGILIR
ncbi:hypothetical protein OHB26_24465 [Nocardia sp. NBC_01503]|uniref:hypothetical protein n=1 Tax=Nocardia sp. NBC_01503 TaxID=2975997 RepID=UPI002E7C2FA1|nr:hypothetical protein [Nocardia sp. NBC_01503]WTL30100.1 hypothetical protein OHB26_24465 [Nocardia sp. NBC_01503]